MGEQNERLMRGPQGEQGIQGQRGERGMTPGARRAVLYLFALTLVLAGLNLYWTSREVDQLRVAVHASCNFAADLGGAPLAANPKTGKAPLLGVKIVSDSRMQWHGLGCPGHLPPPAPSFVHWAKAFGLPYR